MNNPSQEQTSQKEIILRMLFENMSDKARKPFSNPRLHTVNKKSWTPADLFIRQYLNNLEDGLGLIKVLAVYEYLCGVKNVLVENDLVSPKGWNAAGNLLWEDYGFTLTAERIAQNRSYEGINSIMSKEATSHQ